MYETILSESQQDYLKIIHGLVNKNRVARVKEIAGKKGVSMPSVTESMKKLAKEDWIFYQSRGFIELTPKGEKAARYFARRTEFLQNFLHDVLGTTRPQAKTEACSLEHHLSDQSLKRLGLLYQFLNHCPKVDTNLINLFKQCVDNNTEDDYFCIPDVFPHQYQDHKHILLTDLQPRQRAKIMLLSANPETRDFFLNKGLLPGLEIAMREHHPDRFIIRHQNQDIEVPGKFGKQVEVSIVNE